MLCSYSNVCTQCACFAKSNRKRLKRLRFWLYFFFFPKRLCPSIIIVIYSSSLGSLQSRIDQSPDRISNQSQQPDGSRYTVQSADCSGYGMNQVLSVAGHGPGQSSELRRGNKRGNAQKRARGEHRGQQGREGGRETESRPQAGSRANWEMQDKEKLVHTPLHHFQGMQQEDVASHR